LNLQPEWAARLPSALAAFAAALAVGWLGWKHYDGEKKLPSTACVPGAADFLHECGGHRFFPGGDARYAFQRICHSRDGLCR